MNDAWDERRRAKEEEYFEKRELEATRKLAAREGHVRLSPVTGEPMERLTIMGITVDRCPKSGGIWLDAGQLEQIVERAKGHRPDPHGWLSSFIDIIRGR